MKLLKWSSKHDEQFWDVSALPLEEKAYKELFKIMDGDGYYCELEDNLLEVNAVRTDLQALKMHLASFEFKDEFLKKEFNNFVENKLSRYGSSELHKVERQVRLYKEAKEGNLSSMKSLIHLRSDEGYEYESVRIVKV